MMVKHIERVTSVSCAACPASVMDALHVDEFPEARRRVVGEVSSLASGKAGPVLYWMSRDQRVQAAKIRIVRGIVLSPPPLPRPLTDRCWKVEAG